MAKWNDLDFDDFLETEFGPEDIVYDDLEKAITLDELVSYIYTAYEKRKSKNVIRFGDYKGNRGQFCVAMGDFLETGSCIFMACRSSGSNFFTMDYSFYESGNTKKEFLKHGIVRVLKDFYHTSYIKEKYYLDYIRYEGLMGIDIALED